MGTSQSQRGANSAPERASPTKLRTGFQFLTKDFLRFWTVDTRQDGRSQRSAPQKRRRAWKRSGWNRGGDESAAPEESALTKHLVSKATRTRGPHRTQAPPSLRLCAEPEHPNGLDLGSARNPGPTPCRATRSLSSVDGESTHTNPAWRRHCERSPHAPVRFFFSAPPSPQHG